MANFTLQLFLAFSLYMVAFFWGVMARNITWDTLQSRLQIVTLIPWRIHHALTHLACEACVFPLQYILH
jgi:hypothetical protein